MHHPLSSPSDPPKLHRGRLPLLPPAMASYTADRIERRAEVLDCVVRGEERPSACRKAAQWPRCRFAGTALAVRAAQRSRCRASIDAQAVLQRVS